MKKSTLTWIDVVFAIGTVIFMVIATYAALDPDTQMLTLGIFMVGLAWLAASDHLEKTMDKIMDVFFKED